MDKETSTVIRLHEAEDRVEVKRTEKAFEAYNGVHMSDKDIFIEGVRCAYDILGVDEKCNRNFELGIIAGIERAAEALLKVSLELFKDTKDREATVIRNAYYEMLESAKNQRGVLNSADEKRICDLLKEAGVDDQNKENQGKDIEQP
jgi:hypothetical protein